MLRLTFLLSVLTALFLLCGYLIGGPGGMMIALMMAAFGNLFAYWNSGKIVLSMQGARPIDRRHGADLADLVAGLAARAGLPTPKIYIIETAQPNAFATGRNPQNGVVAVTRGLLDTLSRQELAGVIAHELAHIQHRDTLIMTIAATIGGAISALAMIGFWFGGRRDSPLGGLGALLVMILAPLAATLVQMAVSRNREYAADKRAAAICGQASWLASALRRLESSSRKIANPAATNNPATAHLFIVNPLAGGGMARLFATHPPTAERIAALNRLAANGPSAEPKKSARIPISHIRSQPRSRLPRTGSTTGPTVGSKD